jgi:Protein of unknown function (DUF1579)
MKIMKMRMLILTTALAIAVILNAGLAAAQQKDGKAKQKEPSASEMQEMMKKWMELGTPGAAHKFLDQLAGKWDITMLMWMAPNTTPNEMKGTSETRWILDGRFLLEEGNSQMMGMPHRSMGLTGYDNFKKKYIISYMDNLGTAIYSAAGELDAAGKVMTLYGKMDEPMTGEKDKTVKYVMRIVSKDKYIFEAYDFVGKPNEFKAMEAIYTRKP